MSVQIKAALSAHTPTVFIPCFNFILDSTERPTPVDFPSLCNPGSEVKRSTACADISQISALSSGCVHAPAAVPEDPKHTGCQGNLGCGSDFCSVNMFSNFMLIPLWLLVSAAVYLSLVLSADLHIGQFSANTRNSRLLGKTGKQTTLSDCNMLGEGEKHIFPLVQGLLIISIY